MVGVCPLFAASSISSALMILKYESKTGAVKSAGFVSMPHMCCSSAQNLKACNLLTEAEENAISSKFALFAFLIIESNESFEDMRSSSVESIP